MTIGEIIVVAMLVAGLALSFALFLWLRRLIKDGR